VLGLAVVLVLVPSVGVPLLLVLACALLLVTLPVASVVTGIVVVVAVSAAVVGTVVGAVAVVVVGIGASVVYTQADETAGDQVPAYPALTSHEHCCAAPPADTAPTPHGWHEPPPLAALAAKYSVVEHDASAQPLPVADQIPTYSELLSQWHMVLVAPALSAPAPHD
jgi:hypothetical protein